MDTQLLCTFTNKDELDITIDLIKVSYNIVFNRIYVLQNEDDPKELMCTYNIESNVNNLNIVPKTILIHRKKLTNTLYTINALNEIVRDMNNGALNPDTRILWKNYEKMLLLTNTNGLKKIPTRVYKMVNCN